MSRLKAILEVKLPKSIGKALSSAKRDAFGKDVARVYENAERQRYYEGIGGNGNKMSYRYSTVYAKQKAKFVKNKGKLYKERKSSIVPAYRAEKVNDFARLTGQMTEALRVEAIRVQTPLFRGRSKITLKMYIDDLSEAFEYAEDLQRKIKFFGFAYSKLKLPNRYEKQLERIRIKYF